MIGQRFLPIKKFGGTRRLFFRWYVASPGNPPTADAAHPPPPFFSFRYSFCPLSKIAMYIMHTMPFFPWLGSLWIYSKLTVTGAWLAGSTLKWGAGKANEATLQAHVCTHAHTHAYAHTHIATDDATPGAPQVFRCVLEPRVLSLTLFASWEVISPFQGFSTSSWWGLRP